MTPYDILIDRLNPYAQELHIASDAVLGEARLTEGDLAFLPKDVYIDHFDQYGHRFYIFDKEKLAAMPKPQVTADQIRRSDLDKGMGI